MYQKICALSEISNEGELYRYEVGTRPIIVVRLGHDYFAMESTCTHEEADLSLGVLLEDQLMCPLHQAKFNIKTGDVQSGPDGDSPDSIPKLKKYPTKIEGDSLLVDL